MAPSQPVLPPDHTTSLVTCHANADFDAFAAMLAAARLYAPCDLLFPGSQEKNLNKIYEECRDEAGSLVPGCRFVEQSDCNFADYTQLIVVDTRQRSRLRHVWQLIDNPSIRLEAWDHHPDTSDDIHPHITHYAPVGAATTMLVFQLKEKGYTIPQKTATLLGMGLYSDTGSFSYSSTTGEDLEACAWLLRQGMDINTISDQLAFELTSTHVQTLNSLLESAESYTFSGCQVVLAETTLEHYLGDFAYLAHKLMEMEKFTVLFAIGRMDDRIQVVARSRTGAVNVGAVCQALGGGGHVYAASASIKDKSLSQVKDALLNALSMQQSGEKTAADYMSSPAIGIECGRTLREADELMLHFSLKSVPVFAKGTRTCAGLLDDKTAQRALAHGLADESIDDYMSKRFYTLPKDATLKDVTNVIVGQHQRIVPIVEGEETVGIVSRTDLIGIFAQEPGRMDQDMVRSREGKSRNLPKMLQKQLPPSLLRLLSLVARLGREHKVPVYVVGGFVRDVLLKTPNSDIDLVVEGDGLAFAALLAKELHGRARNHDKFLTSCVLYTDEEGKEARVDVASTRLEYYECPAALPTVEHSSIKMDLYRRDFSINALALRLDTEPMGKIVDFFSGQKDIKDKVIRVLHSLSFVEDPTRILRAVRFEERYHFRLGAATEKLLRNAVSMHLLDKLSPARVFHEFNAICNEEQASAILCRLQELGILQSLHPLLSFSGTTAQSLAKAAKILAWYKMLYLERKIQNWLVCFLSLTGHLSYNDALLCFRRLGLPEAMKTTVMQGREQVRTIRPVLRRLFAKGEPSPSAVCALVQKVPMEALLWLLSEEGNADIRRALSRYITVWQFAAPDLTGKELKDLGLPSGPDCGTILRLLLNAKLDHTADTPVKQYQLASELVQKALAGTLEEACQANGSPVGSAGKADAS